MSDPHRDAMIAKIQALLAKTTEAGCTEAEAAAAAELAARLMDQYQISISEAEIAAEGEIFANIYASKTWKLCAYIWIAPAIERFTGTVSYRDYAVKDVIFKRGKLSRKRSKPFLRFFGKQSDVDFADWLCRSLGDFILIGEELDEMKHFFGRPATQSQRILFRNGYIDGAARRICDRLDKITLERSTAIQASGRTDLVPVNKTALATCELANQHGIKLGTVNSGRTCNKSGQTAGERRGDQASFGRPVGSGGNGTVVYLGKH